MAILSKLVSGLVSVATNKALYVAGIIVATLAKPACEYTVKLILRDTSVALANAESSIKEAFAENQKILLDISVTLANTESSIEDALAKNQKIIQEYIFNTVNEMNQFTMNEIKSLNTQISILMNEIKTNQNNEDIVNKIVEMQMQLPDKEYIASMAKKYAMYLHDEHIEIMNICRYDDTVSNASSVQIIPTPRLPTEVPRLGPIKFAPPPISVPGVPKLRKPLSARSVN